MKKVLYVLCRNYMYSMTGVNDLMTPLFFIKEYVHAKGTNSESDRLQSMSNGTENRASAETWHDLILLFSQFR